MSTEQQTQEAPRVEFSHYALANIADCYSPTEGSAGAAFLLSVQSDVNDLEIGADITDASDLADDISAIADSAPDVYTATRWAEFVDLGAFHEDPTEFGDLSDMESAAGICLYIIAERLAQSLVTTRIQDRDFIVENSDES